MDCHQNCHQMGNQIHRGLYNATQLVWPTFRINKKTTNARHITEGLWWISLFYLQLLSSLPLLFFRCVQVVFMGSEKYPSENGFDAFLKKHGGSDNASTDCERTIFQFDVQRKSFKEALDRWGRFRVCIIFRAVDLQKWTPGEPSDDFQINQIHRRLKQGRKSTPKNMLKLLLQKEMAFSNFMTKPFLVKLYLQRKHTYQFLSLLDNERPAYHYSILLRHVSML